MRHSNTCLPAYKIGLLASHQDFCTNNYVPLLVCCLIIPKSDRRLGGGLHSTLHNEQFNRVLNNVSLFMNADYKLVKTIFRCTNWSCAINWRVYIRIIIRQNWSTSHYTHKLISHNIKITCLILCRSPLYCQNISNVSRHKTSELVLWFLAPRH